MLSSSSKIFRECQNIKTIELRPALKDNFQYSFSNRAKKRSDHPLWHIQLQQVDFWLILNASYSTFFCLPWFIHFLQLSLTAYHASGFLLSPQFSYPLLLLGFHPELPPKQRDAHEIKGNFTTKMDEKR